MDVYDQRVNRLFNDWQSCRANLQDHSQRLQKAMQQHVDGKAPLPSELSTKMRELRQECDVLFEQVLEAIKDRARAHDKP